MALRRRSKDAQNDFFPGFADVVEIGSGSLSIVYRAREVASGRWFALKLLTAAAATGAAATVEAQAAPIRSLATHPNVVDLYGSFRAADGRPVLVLALCATSVADLMPSGAGLPVRDVVSLGVKIAGALETAHRAGIRHGDVRPQNVLVIQSGQPALGDFGLSTLRSSTPLTVGRIEVRTMHAAPELLAGAETSAATDVYALASTLYQLVSGCAAFDVHAGEPPAVLLQRIANDPVPPLTELQAPPRLSDLLVYSMSKDPAGRPPSAAEFAAELGTIEAEQQWPRTEFIVRTLSAAAPSPHARPQAAPPPPAAASGWTPPPAQDWFGDGQRAAAPPGSTHLSEPIRSAPRHARPDDDDPAVGAPVEAPAPPAGTRAMPAETRAPQRTHTEERTHTDAPQADVPGPSPAFRDVGVDEDEEVDEDVGVDEDEEVDEDAAFEAPAVLAPPTSANPVLPRSTTGPDEWSDVSLSPAAGESASPLPPPGPGDVPVALDPPPRQVPASDGPPSPEAPGPPEGEPAGVPAPGKTTAHPIWRQARLAASTSEGGDTAPPPTEQIPDTGDTVARYPIPPVTGDDDQQAGAVPSWAFREPAQVPATARFGSDLTLDPMSLRRRVIIRSGGHAVVVDDERLVVRAWLRRSELAWPDVLGFEPRFDGVGASGSGGRLVAITRSGPVELPATKRSMADLRYVQALLDAYRHRAQMSVNG